MQQGCAMEAGAEKDAYLGDFLKKVPQAPQKLLYWGNVYKHIYRKKAFEGFKGTFLEKFP